LNFDEAYTYLLSLGNEVEAMKLGLENIRTLLAELGNPQEKYLKVQVAGTNGKGSVCAFLDSICGQAGIRRGLYTSPHLVSITERIKIDGADISEGDFARLATVVRAESERLLAEGKLQYTPTFFEQVTAIALLAFAEAKVELAILETGLGGRLDAITAANAEICAITQIALDHQEFLGETIEEIAAEKAAIIGPKSKAVLLHQSKNVERVLLGRCREVGVDPVWASTDIKIKRDPEVAPMLFGTITTEKDAYARLDFWNMLGEHQFQNASIAIAIAELLKEESFQISNDEICIGLETTIHPGRLEYIGNFLLDGAHNVAGAKALAAYLDEFVEKPFTMIFGAMRDKDVAEMAKVLWPRAERLILTQPSNARAMTAAELSEFVPEIFDPVNVVITNSVEDAVAATIPTELVLVTGSLYLVGEVRKIALSR
jgi:dihydrofolate synthase / folylpolyglutamate synthase